MTPLEDDEDDPEREAQYRHWMREQYKITDAQDRAGADRSDDRFPAYWEDREPLEKHRRASMTPLELAKGVVERSKRACAESPTGIMLSPHEAEAIGRLVAWAECQRAMDAAYDDGKQSDERDEVIRSHGWDGRVPRTKFVRALRDACIKQ